MSELLSVVVPIYNVEKYLDRCVLSILNQTYQNIELILVDDGSPDNCPEKCDKWKMQDTRIRVIHKPNGGLADARNAGLDVATGKYIAFVDSDDTIHPEMYAVMISKMEQNGAQIACCGKNKIYPDKLISTQNRKTELIMTASEAIGRLLEGVSIDESACDKVFVRSLFEGIRFPKGETNEDLPIMPGVFSEAKKVVHVAANYYNYFQNPGSITRSGYSSKMHVYISHLTNVENFIQEKYPELKQSLSILKARYACAMLYRIKDEKKKYASDYMWYRKAFNESVWPYITNNAISKKNRILALAMRMGFGNLVSKMNALIKSHRK